jgi:hypothetical protein
MSLWGMNRSTTALVRRLTLREYASLKIVIFQLASRWVAGQGRGSQGEGIGECLPPDVSPSLLWRDIINNVT